MPHSITITRRNFEHHHHHHTAWTCFNTYSTKLLTKVIWLIKRTREFTHVYADAYHGLITFHHKLYTIYFSTAQTIHTLKKVTKNINFFIKRDWTWRNELFAGNLWRKWSKHSNYIEQSQLNCNSTWKVDFSTICYRRQFSRVEDKTYAMHSCTLQYEIIVNGWRFKKKKPTENWLNLQNSIEVYVFVCEMCSNRFLSGQTFVFAVFSRWHCWNGIVLKCLLYIFNEAIRKRDFIPKWRWVEKIVFMSTIHYEWNQKRASNWWLKTIVWRIKKRRDHFFSRANIFPNSTKYFVEN